LGEPQAISMAAAPAMARIFANFILYLFLSFNSNFLSLNCSAYKYIKLLEQFLKKTDDWEKMSTERQFYLHLSFFMPILYKSHILGTKCQ